MTFSPEELRLLAVSDRAIRDSVRKRGFPRLRMLGRLTDAQALLLSERGASRQELARAADVSPDTVSTWLRRMESS